MEKVLADERATSAEAVARYWEANAAAWTRLVRGGFDVYRDRLNTPAFLAMLPDVGGLVGLDVGCGEGANTRQLASLGARMTGIDIAASFIEQAALEEARQPLGIDYRLADGTALPFADASLDFATAFMSLMDMHDPAKALSEICRVLRAGGFVQYSILHPCFVPLGRRNVKNGEGRTVAIEISDYFGHDDGAIDSWWFSAMPKADRAEVPPFRIPRFHRTLAEWLNMTARTGLAIEQVGEPRADESLARAEPVVADTRIAPIFLHVRARKAG